MRPEELDVCLEIKILPRYDQSNVTAQMTQPLWESVLEEEIWTLDLTPLLD